MKARYSPARQDEHVLKGDDSLQTGLARILKFDDRRLGLYVSVTSFLTAAFAYVEPDRFVALVDVISEETNQNNCTAYL